jgi:hypothetical protein
VLGGDEDGVAESRKPYMRPDLNIYGGHQLAGTRPTPLKATTATAMTTLTPRRTSSPSYIRNGLRVP